MTKYIVRSISKATEANDNFAGEVILAHYGKENHLINHCGSHANAIWRSYPAWARDIREYGYDTEAAARRNWTYRNPENTKFWTSTVSILKVEV